MEKLSNKTYDLLFELEVNSNDEFLKQLVFITYFLKQNPFNDDLEFEKENWLCSDHFVDDWQRTTTSLLSCFENKDKILYDLVLDADDILHNYLTGHLRDIKNISQIIKEFVNTATTDELSYLLKGYILKPAKKGDSLSSSSVVQLSKKILRINESDSVIDLCSGKGRFLSSISETDNLTGIEIDYNNIKDSYILCLLNDVKPYLKHQDALTYQAEGFDKVFCEYPWSQIYNRPLQYLGCEKWKPLPVKDLKRSMISWIFVAKVLSILKEDGIAIVHCNEGALFSTYEKDIRRLAVDKGLIKGVIALPQRMNPTNSVTSSLLVLSYGNQSIRFVDATSFGKINPLTKCNELSERDIQTIAELLNSNQDTAIAKTIKLDEIDASYLNVPRYLHPTKAPVAIENGKKIELIVDDFIKSVIANSSYLTDDSLTGIKVLCSSDIKDGSFNINNLQYVSEEGLSLLPKNWESQILKDGDVIMTNKSTVIKSAVASIENEKVVLFGSLCGMRLKQDNMLPMYLCSFINSNTGQLLLKTIQTGTIISMITLSNLRNLVIPCPSIEDQAALCEQISITLDMIRESRDRIEKLQKGYEGFFDKYLTEKE